MAETPAWHLAGDWFDVCSCDVPCLCEFAQPPTGNHCQGVLAYHIREGHYGDVRLDGLNLVGLGEFEGNIWAGAKVALGLFLATGPTRRSSGRCKRSSAARPAVGRRSSPRTSPSCAAWSPPRSTSR